MWTKTGTWISGGATRRPSSAARRASPKCARRRLCWTCSPTDHHDRATGVGDAAGGALYACLQPEGKTMKVTLDLTKLLENGQIDQAEYDKFSALAAKGASL